MSNNPEHIHIGVTQTYLLPGLYTLAWNCPKPVFYLGENLLDIPKLPTFTGFLNINPPADWVLPAFLTELMYKEDVALVLFPQTFSQIFNSGLYIPFPPKS